MYGLPKLLEEKHLLAGDDGSFEFREVAEGDWLLRAIVPAAIRKPIGRAIAMGWWS